jgi:hypothetical protein
VFINFILILSAVIATRVYWESTPHTTTASEKHKRPRHFRFSTDATPSTTDAVPPPPFSQPDPKVNYRWRENVRSTVVEHAWETLCGSIVQEFIYDTWYHYLSPDKEFPAEIRRILNHAFGRLAARSRTIELRLVMEDASELLMEQLELYRDTKEAVISDAQQNLSIAAALTQGDLATREQLLRERMEVDGNLHPALLHPEGDYKMLTAVSGGLVGLLLDPADSNRAALRAVARELLSGCVLRPLMMWCTPYHVNRGLYKVLAEQATRQTAPAPPISSQQRAGGAVPELDLAKTRAMQGHWEFEQRIVKNVEAEATRLQPQVSLPPSRPTSSRTSMPPPPPRTTMRHHARSRSHDGLIQSASAAIAAIDGVDVSGGVNGGSLGAEIGPPDAQPARFWSETQQASALSSPQQEFSKDGAGGDGGGRGAIKNLAAAAATTVDVSSNSITSQTSSMSATSPVRQGPRDGTAEGCIASFPVAQMSDTTGGGGGSVLVNGDGSEIASELTRPSPFDDNASSASFSGLVGAPIGGGAHGEGVSAHQTGEEHPLDAPVSSTQQEECFKRPSPAESLPGFIGLPRARVVAADLNTSGAKDLVVYKIRVGDDSGREWTVSRRYRHFEVLHRQLRGASYYKSKLPAKRIFIHTHTEDFVEDRRNALDTYLQEVLSIPCLARSGDVWEFLRIDSERFEVPGMGERGGDGGSFGGTANGTAGGGPTLKRGLSRTVLAGASSVGRGVVGAAVDVTRGVTMGVHEVTNAAVDGVGAVLNEARSGFAGLRHRRSASVPEELQDFDPSTANFGFYGSRTLSKKGDPLTRAGTGLLRTATASARKVRQVLKSQPSLSQQQQQQQYDVAGDGGVYGEDEGSVHSGAARALHFGNGGSAAAAAAGSGIVGFGAAAATAVGEGPSRSESSSGNILRSTRSYSPTKLPKGSSLARKGSTARPPRGSSPVKHSRRASGLPAGLAGASTSASEGYYGVAERAAAFAPGYQPGNIISSHNVTGGGGYYTETGFSQERATTTAAGLSDPTAGGVGGGLGISLYNEIDDFGACSPPSSADSHYNRGAGGDRMYGGGGSTSTSPVGGGGGGGGFGGSNHPLINSRTNSSNQLDAEAGTGISAPLYELVDCVFQLQTRGFFRRQVYAVARQVLSMAIGDAIDVYLLAKLSLLRQESTIGRVIQLIQSSLWPGGIWFQRTPQFKALHPEISHLSFEEELMSPTARGSVAGRGEGPGPGMQADKYLTPAGPSPLDEEEVREAVWELLLRKAPGPLLRLVGKTPYNEGVQDLYEMIQSPTFMKQLGYGLLEIAALHLCPELKGLFQNLESNPNL